MTKYIFNIHNMIIRECTSRKFRSEGDKIDPSETSSTPQPQFNYSQSNAARQSPPERWKKFRIENSRTIEKGGKAIDGKYIYVSLRTISQ